MFRKLINLIETSYRLSEETLLEGRDAPLYHACSINNAISILYEDTMKASTWQLNKHLGTYDAGDPFKRTNGVSLTRDLHFAKEWGDVIFEIDQTLLSRTYRLIPLDYWSVQDVKGQSYRINSPDHNDAESEEFCIGSIYPVSKYLTYVRVREGALSFYMAKSEARINLIADHPLLRLY